MSISYFNWHELLQYSRKDLAAIICLAYAQTNRYNELSAKTMMYRLNLHHVPAFLFSAKTFRQYKHVLTCNYKTKDPQSYFMNSEFLFAKESAWDKVVYLRALSIRRLTDKNTSINRKFFSKIIDNPFLEFTDDTIHFPLENNIKNQRSIRRN